MNEKTKTAHVIAFGNQKGGCGKTTTTVNIAAALGELGKKVLVIDLDGNCGATIYMGVPTDWEGTYEAMIGKAPAESLILRTDPIDGISLPPNVELLAASRTLEEYDEGYRRAKKDKFARADEGLFPVIDDLKEKYDYILLDTAPNSYSPTLAAYRTAEWFVLVTKPEQLSIDKLQEAMQDIALVRQNDLNRELKLLGVVMCAVDRRTNLAIEYLEQINVDFAGAGARGAFKTFTNRSTVVDATHKEHVTLIEHAPSHKVTEEFRQLAREINDRVEGTAGTEAALSDITQQPKEQGDVANAS